MMYVYTAGSMSELFRALFNTRCFNFSQKVTALQPCVMVTFWKSHYYSVTLPFLMVCWPGMIICCLLYRSFEILDFVLLWFGTVLLSPDNLQLETQEY